MAKPSPKLPGQSGAKFSDLEREEIKEKVALYDRQGHSQYSIVAELAKQGISISQPQISIYLSQMKEEYKARAARHRAELISEKVEQYRDVRRIAWAGYEKSMQDADKELSKYYPLPQGTESPTQDQLDSGDYTESMRRIEFIKRKEGRIPANEFLNTILTTLKAECALLGLDEQPPSSNQVNVGVQVNNVLTLKGILDAAKSQMEIGKVPLLPAKESVNGHHSEELQ